MCSDAKGKRRRGRPRADDPGVAVATWLRTKDYDDLIRKAKLQDRTIAALIRDRLTFKL